MGLIKTIIIAALIVVGILFFLAMIQISTEQDDCLEEIAEDYCKDNGMSFNNVHKSDIAFIRPGDFSCKDNERATKLEFYSFLEDEIEECKI